MLKWSLTEMVWKLKAVSPSLWRQNSLLFSPLIIDLD